VASRIAVCPREVMCRKSAHRARMRASRPAPVRTARALRADPVHLAAEAAEYARSLAAEAERDLKRNPERQPWRRTTEIPDRRHRTGQDRRAEP
jgi:hypothetical protein